MLWCIHLRRELSSDIKSFRKYELAGIALAAVAIVFEFFIFMKTDQSFHDFQTFADSAALLKKGDNPYLDPFFLNSYTLSIPLNKYATLFPAPLGSTLWNILNALGLYGFIRFISPKLSILNQLWVVVLVLASSPARAMFASVQHTGVILGLLALALFLASVRNLQYLSVSRILAGVVLVVPFELKPQFAVPIILIFLFRKEFRFSFKIWLFATASLHALVSLFFKMPLDLFWISRLAGRSDVTTKVDSGDNSFWILPSSIFGHAHLWLILGFIFYTLALLFQILLILKPIDLNLLLMIGVIIPILLPYFHTYDYLVIFTIVSARYFQEKATSFGTFAVFLFLLPTVSDASHLGVKILIAIVTFMIIEFVRSRYHLLSKAWISYVGLLLTAEVYYICYEKFQVENLRISILLTVASILCFFSFRPSRVSSSVDYS